VTARILAAASPGEVRVAVVQGAVLADYAIWRPGRPDGVGDLYRGRVTAQAPALGGAFVALPGGDGFLPDTEGGRGLTLGTVLGLRVIRAAQGGKGPRVSAKLSDASQALVGSGPPALLRRGQGAVERLAAAWPDAPVETDDAALAAALRPLLGARLALRPAVLVDAVAAAIDALAEPEMALPGGARLSIHPTPALVAIDIDSGTDSGGHKALNRALLPALARQIRLRNLSGAILVDFAGMPVRRRSALGPALVEALGRDPLRPRLLGFTALGLAEIVRPRIHPPLHEQLAGPHAAGLAALRAIAAAVAADPTCMPALRAAPGVVRALQEDAVALADLARRTGRSTVLRSDPSLPGSLWTLEAP
jgi:Ribonuclease G/E